ncbi:Protein FAR1-RELATED SEQUENCE 5 [Hordeum vulgare]|nr:Protein FAR1-RELATED SEQUENCE 5 [Hordeum vulgare]
MRRDRQRDVVAVGEDGGDGEHMGRPGLSWSPERTDTAAADLLDILSGDEVRGGYGIDDDMVHVTEGEGSYVHGNFSAPDDEDSEDQPERVRYYRSHRSIPSKDYQLLLTVHDVNLSNSECMSVLGRIHGGDTRILPYNIERQVAAYYTRSVFGKFQKQVTTSTDFIINQDIDYQGHGAMFELKATSYENPKAYSVRVVMDEGLFECSCHYFEMNGLICAHIIRAMFHLNVQVIPQQYLLERWSEAATTSMGRTGRLLDFGHPSTNTLKYNSLCRRLTWLASNACCNDDAYRILDDAIKALEPAIAAAKRGAMHVQQAAQQSEPPTAAAAATVPLNGDMR